MLGRSSSVQSLNFRPSHLMQDEQDDHDQAGLRRRGWPEQTTMPIRSLAAFAATRLRCLVPALVRAHRQLIANLGWHPAVLQYTCKYSCKYKYGYK